MRRGEIWTAAGGKGYAGKPHPVVVLQDDRFDLTESCTCCPFTTDESAAELFRPRIQPDNLNGLRHESRLKADRITTTPRTKLGERIGRLSEKDMDRVDRAVLVYLGLAGAPGR